MLECICCMLALNFLCITSLILWLVISIPHVLMTLNSGILHHKYQQRIHSKTHIMKGYYTFVPYMGFFSLSSQPCFRPRENKEIAATAMLRFAPDIRAPVDPISKLREYLKKQKNLDILQVRLLVGKCL